MNFNRQFSEILTLAKQARYNALKNVNAELVNLYWQVGEYISRKVDNAEWGMNVVDKLATFIEKKEPMLKGFDRRGLYRMKQFYEAYCNVNLSENTSHSALPKKVSAVRSQIASPLKNKKVSAVPTQIYLPEKKHNTKVSAVPTQIRINELSSIKNTVLAKINWTNHLLILSKTSSEKERIFYLLLTVKENYSSRELERQINSGFYERTMLSKKKVSPLVSQMRKDISSIFKDTYVFEFLNLPDGHSENDLKKGLVQNIKKLLLELGKDFSLVGEEYKIKVGKKDFFIDLLFYHRELCCLVAFELKIEDFQPDHLGKINFYLEALDRDVKKKHENPSVGILLCKNNDEEVVEYALSRHLSPTLVSKYNTKLIDKKLLKKKLHELFQMEETKLLSKKITTVRLKMKFVKTDSSFLPTELWGFTRNDNEGREKFSRFSALPKIVPLRSQNHCHSRVKTRESQKNLVGQ